MESMNIKGLAKFLVAFLAPISMLVGCNGSGSSTEESSVTVSSTGGGGSAPEEVIFSAYEAIGTPGQLFRGAVDGSVEPTRLSNFLTLNAGVMEFKVSPDKSTVAFIALNDSSVPEMFVVPVAGGSPQAVAVLGTSSLDLVDDFGWAPDSSRLAFVAKTAPTGNFKLYTCLPNGAGLTEVSGIMVSGGNVQTLAWAPDSSRIAYSADQDTDGFVELYSSVPNGSGNSKINQSISGALIDGFAWAPDSSRLAYRHIISGTSSLFSAEADGSERTSMNGTLVAGGNVGAFSWAPDASRLAYIADQDVDNRRELYITLADGSANAKVHPVLSSNSDVSSLEWAPDGSRIAYLADQDADEVFELYSSAASGGDNQKINASLAPDGDVVSYSWAPNSSRLAFLANQTIGGSLELYMGLANGSSVSQMTTAQDVLIGVKWSPDSSRVAYAGQALPATQYNVYTIAPGGVSVLIDQDLPISNNTNPLFMWSPDSNRLLHIANQTGGSTITSNLRSSAAVGGSDSLISGTTITSSGHISSYSVH